MQNNTIQAATDKQKDYLVSILSRLKTSIDHEGINLEGITSEEVSALIQKYGQQLKVLQANLGGGQQVPPQAPQQAPKANYAPKQNYAQAPQQAPMPQYQQMPPQQNTYVPTPQQDFVPNGVIPFDDVATKVNNELNALSKQGKLIIPENYNVGNAIKNAMFAIKTSEQSSKLLACSTDSIAQAFTAYAIQGLDAGKNQAYFIPYGNTMKMMRSYFGDVAVAKRSGVIKDVYANVIYQGDVVEVGFDELGRRTITKHTTKFENADNEIVGAYAVMIGANGYKAYEIMTIAQIKKSWKMSKAQSGKLLTDYQDEAAKRTVIRRAVKMFFNTTNDLNDAQTNLINSFNATMADEYKDNTNGDERKYDDVESVYEYQQQQSAQYNYNPNFDELNGN